MCTFSRQAVPLAVAFLSISFPHAFSFHIPPIARPSQQIDSRTRQSVCPTSRPFDIACLRPSLSRRSHIAHLHAQGQDPKHTHIERHGTSGSSLVGAPPSKAKTILSFLLLFGLVVGFSPQPALAAATAAVEIADPRRIIALLLSSSAIGMWAEEHTKIGSIISGAMVTFFCAMLFTAFGMLPASSNHVGHMFIMMVPIVVLC
jgi:hypothetical protein